MKRYYLIEVQIGGHWQALHLCEKAPTAYHLYYAYAHDDSYDDVRLTTFKAPDNDVLLHKNEEEDLPW